MESIEKGVAGAAAKTGIRPGSTKIDVKSIIERTTRLCNQRFGCSQLRRWLIGAAPTQLQAVTRKTQAAPTATEGRGCGFDRSAPCLPHIENKRMGAGFLARLRPCDRLVVGADRIADSRGRYQLPVVWMTSAWHHRGHAREDPPMKWYIALTWILLAALLGFFGVLSGTITI
jgi:hypothetical protein